MALEKQGPISSCFKLLLGNESLVASSAVYTIFPVILKYFLGLDRGAERKRSRISESSRRRVLCSIFSYGGSKVQITSQRVRLDEPRLGLPWTRRAQEHFQSAKRAPSALNERLKTRRLIKITADTLSFSVRRRALCKPFFAEDFGLPIGI